MAAANKPITVEELLQLPGNSKCADCQCQLKVLNSWTSINLGIFICMNCAGVHRSLGVHHSKVRSINLDTSFTPEQIEFLRVSGNSAAKKLYEYHAPCFYLRPSNEDVVSDLVRENWIKAKYVRKEFMNSGDMEEGDFKHHPSVFFMPEPPREGYVWKRNPKGAWQRRWFMLHMRWLYWFKQSSDSFAANKISLDRVEFCVPGTMKAKEEFGKRLVLEMKTPTKNYVLGFEKMEELFAWVHALRRAHYFFSNMKQNVEEKEREINKNVTFEDLKRTGLRKQGWLTKQGGRWKTWNRRWCVLDQTGTLFYFKRQPELADNPEGGLNLDNSDVSDAEEKTHRKFCFSTITPQRVFFMCADSISEMHEWMRTLKEIVYQITRRRKVDFAKLLMQ